MCGLAQIFESQGFSTVLVGFVKEHMEIIKPPRALWLNFPMGRPMGKPNDPEFQKNVIRVAFELLQKSPGPVLEDFPEIIPVKEGRMSYALPVDLVYKVNQLGDIDKLTDEVNKELSNLMPDYLKSIDINGRTTVGASEMKISDFVPYISEFAKGNKPKSPRKGLPAIPLLKLVVEDLNAVYTETRIYRDKIDNFEILGKWFWEETNAGKLLLAIEAVSLESDDQVLRQIASMSLLTPRFWSEGPLPGISGSGWT